MCYISPWWDANLLKEVTFWLTTQHWDSPSLCCVFYLHIIHSTSSLTSCWFIFILDQVHFKFHTFLNLKKIFFHHFSITEYLVLSFYPSSLMYCCLFSFLYFLTFILSVDHVQKGLALFLLVNNSQVYHFTAVDWKVFPNTKQNCSSNPGTQRSTVCP